VRILLVEDAPSYASSWWKLCVRKDSTSSMQPMAMRRLAWCGRRVVDVPITDVKLPGSVDGWQIAERCREHDPDRPVIYATGFSPVAPVRCPEV
jgi:DNA-binding NtrC family response regulator